VLTDNLDECDFIIGLKNHLKNNLNFISSARKKGVPIYVIKNNDMSEIRQIITYCVSNEKLKKSTSVIKI
jgi:hypothetical protein